MLLFENRKSLHYGNSERNKSNIINNFSERTNKKHIPFNSIASILKNSVVKTMRKKQSSSKILTYDSPGSTTNVVDPVQLKTPTLVGFRKKNYTDVDFIPKKEHIDDLDKNRDMVVTEEEDDESTVDYYGEEDDYDEDIIPEYTNLVVGPITTKELNEVLMENKLTVIFFYTYWCKYCEILDVYWNIMSSDEKFKADFIKINNDYAGEITAKYDIKNVPSFLILKRTSDVKIEIIDKLTGVRIKELTNIILDNTK
jgi:thiol-disulfide isomerase/thioredoxin